MESTNSKPVINFTSYIDERTQHFTGRAWVFKAIDQWLTQPDGSRFFLLTGEPGSGKTAVAAYLVQLSAGKAAPLPGSQQLRPGCLSAVHFCRAAASDWTDPRTFARSISLQLAIISEFALALKDVGDKEINIDVQQQVGTAQAGSSVTGVKIENLITRGLNGQEAFNRMVLDPLRTIYNQGYSQPILILVDSLDEALASATDVTIVDLLAGLQGLSEHVRFILTSRLEPRVENKFLAASGLSLSDPAYVTANNQDVVHYVTQRIQQDQELGSKIAALSSAQAAALPDLITAIAEGNFQYVVFLLKAAVAGQQALDNLAGLPSGLDGLYFSSLERVIKLGKKDWSTAYKPLLGALSVAQEPLTLAQLQTFTGLSGDAWDVLIDLRQFVETASERLPTVNQEEAEDRYRLYHQSVADFLCHRQLVVTVNGQKKTLDNIYRVLPDDWHKRIVTSYEGTSGGWTQVDWSQIDAYGLHHLPAHLSLAGQLSLLQQLLLTFGWLQAKTGRLGVYAVLDDLHIALSELSTTSEIQLSMIDWLHVLDREAHNLHTWDPKQFPAFFAQQIYNQAVQMQLTNLVTVAAERLAQLNQPYLALRFRVPNESPALLRTLLGHTQKVIAAPDNIHVLSISNVCLKVWNIETGQEIRSLDGEWDPIGFTKDGNQAILSSDSALTFWEWGTGKIVHVAHSHEDWVRALAVTNKGHFAVCVAQDHKLRLVDLATGTVVRRFSGPTSSIGHLVITSDDIYIIVATWRRGIRRVESQLQMWELGTGQQVTDFTFDTLNIRGLALAPNGGLLIASYMLYSHANELKVWDLQTRREVRTLAINDYPGNMVVTPDSRYVIVANTVSPGNLRVWDLQTGQEIASFAAHSYPINNVTMTPNGRYIISASSTDHELKVWDLQVILLKQGQSLPGHHFKPVWFRALTPDGRFAILTSEDNTLKVWDLDVQQEVYAPFVGHTSPVRGPVITSDNRYAISFSWSDNTPLVWDLKLGQKIYSLEGHTHGVRALALVPSDQYIISGSLDTTLRIWDLQTGQPINGPLSVGDEVWAVAVTPDGRRAVAASPKKVTVLDLETRRVLYTFNALHKPIDKLVLTPNGRYAFSIATYDKTIGMYDLNEGQMLPSLADHSDWVRNLAVTSDGHYAISASNDGTLRVWNLKTKQTVSCLTGHTDWVYDMVLTEDNRRVFSVSQDRTVRVWDWRTGEVYPKSWTVEPGFKCGEQEPEKQH